ncbi:MAG: hypothetical protein P1P80_00640 [ANME-2 cluster archaeon]|nr:hypothetical protein [ANME-2 cluster archaeon]
MIDRIFLLILIFGTMAFGTMTLVIGYFTLQKLSSGRIKDYGMVVWYALIFFSIGVGIHSLNLLFNYESIFGINLVYFEYLFYCGYYIILLYALFSLYRMAKFIGFSRRSQEMKEAMQQIQNKGKSDDP